MSKAINVAEAKKRFSEIISRVVYTGERFVVERKGKPMAAMVSVSDLKKIEGITPSGGKRGLLAAVGAWEDFKNLDKVIESIYKQRRKAGDRKIRAL